MENVLWKSRRRRNTESVGFKKRKFSSSSSSSSSSGKGRSDSRKKRDEGTRKRRARETQPDDVDYDEYDYADYIDAALLNDPVNEFIRSYMRAVAKYWPMFEMKPFQFHLTCRRRLSVNVVKRSCSTSSWVSTEMGDRVAIMSRNTGRPMFEMKDSEMRDVFQSVLTRTTIASNMNRTTLTNAGVPFKEFVVTCRYYVNTASQKHPLHLRRVPQ